MPSSRQPSLTPSATPSTRQPSTRQPSTRAPSNTAAPTATLNTISASQQLQGITATKWNTAAAINCEIFALTVEAVTNSALQASQIDNCIVLDVITARRSLLSVGSALLRGSSSIDMQAVYHWYYQSAI